MGPRIHVFYDEPFFKWWNEEYYADEWMTMERPMEIKRKVSVASHTAAATRGMMIQAKKIAFGTEPPSEEECQKKAIPRSIAKGKNPVPAYQKVYAAWKLSATVWALAETSLREGGNPAGQ